MCGSQKSDWSIDVTAGRGKMTNASSRRTSSPAMVRNDNE